MARFLAHVTARRGHLYPLVPTLQELLRRGHHVAIHSSAEDVSSLEALGIRSIREDLSQPEPIDADIGAGGRHLREVQTLLSRGRREAADFQRVLEEEQPDALIVDGASWGAGIVAEARCLPWAYAVPFCLPVRSRDAPPFGLGLVPRHDLVGKARDAFARRLLLGPQEKRIRRSINMIRDGWRLPPIRDAADLFLVPPLVIAYTAVPFEYPRSDWPSAVRMVGPGVWDPPATPPEWLSSIDVPLVLVTCSSDLQYDGRLVEVCLEALADTDAYVVVTTAAVEPSGFATAANVRIERFIPHRMILPRATCVVCHGGMGITQKALAAGVPVCAVPFARDQFEVARRLEVSLSGTRLPSSRLTAGRLRAAVAGAISRKEGARRVELAFRAAGGPGAAADALERLLPPQLRGSP
jgi:MGT family glycosyltransferase